MNLHACIIFGILSTVHSQSRKICFEDDCYIKPFPNAQSNWSEAQKICEALNGTLPIIDDISKSQRNLEAAYRNFSKSDEGQLGMWLGARASFDYPGNWIWVDGKNYTDTDIVDWHGQYYKSYAYISNTSDGVRAQASPPNASYFYICYYPNSTAVCANDTEQTAFYIGSRCYVKYANRLSWFSARNNCLTNGGDLASFTQLSLLGGRIDSNKVWVGLRCSQWFWKYGATGMSLDVTFTSWKSGQPDDPDPNCINIDTYGNDFTWRDWDCTHLAPVICQVVNATVTTTQQTSKPSFMTPSGSNSTGSSAALNIPAGTHESTGAVNIPLAVGIGVGIGVPVVIVVLVVIIVFIVRRKQRHGAVSWNSRFKNKHDSKNSSSSPEAETSQMDEIDEMDAGPTRSDNNSSAQYASIREATRSNLDSDPVPPSNQGTVYAPLGFNQAD